MRNHNVLRDIRLVQKKSTGTLLVKILNVPQLRNAMRLSTVPITIVTHAAPWLTVKD